MHPADIQALIKKAGYTQAALAEEYGCTPFHLHRIIYEQKGSEPLMRFICQKVGRKPKKVFPDFFEIKQKQKQKNAA